jgi:insertion element IS1 protein InsB
MIRTIVTHTCPRCGSVEMVKNGNDYKGAQKYHCKSCGAYGTLQAQRGYGEQQRTQVKRALLERVSLRGIERIFALSRRTVSRWLRAWWEQVAAVPISTSLLPAQVEDVLELDEMWSFVGSKAHERWLSVALCRRTRQVVAYWVGDRSENSALHLWRNLPNDYLRCASFSDGWQAYGSVFDLRRHQMVGKDTGHSAHTERWFNTVRQRLARFTRRTLAFSKQDAVHVGLVHH